MKQSLIDIDLKHQRNMKVKRKWRSHWLSSLESIEESVEEPKQSLEQSLVYVDSSFLKHLRSREKTLHEFEIYRIFLLHVDVSLYCSDRQDLKMWGQGLCDSAWILLKSKKGSDHEKEEKNNQEKTHGMNQETETKVNHVSSDQIAMIVRHDTRKESNIKNCLASLAEKEREMERAEDKSVK